MCSSIVHGDHGEHGEPKVHFLYSSNIWTTLSLSDSTCKSYYEANKATWSCMLTTVECRWNLHNFTWATWAMSIFDEWIPFQFPCCEGSFFWGTWVVVLLNIFNFLIYVYISECKSIYIYICIQVCIYKYVQIFPRRLSFSHSLLNHKITSP